MDALVADASREGTLNVIALPPDWANYGNIIKAFTDKYGIKINSANPDGSSQDEINAVKQLGTQDRAPDVLDLGQSFATRPTPRCSRPTRWPTWDTIPAANKDPNGALVQRLRRLHLHRLQRQARPELPHDVRRPAQARVQGPGRAQRRPHPGRGRVRRRLRGGAGQRRLASTTSSPASTSSARSRRAATSSKVDPDPGHHRERPDADRPRLGLPQRHPGRQGEGVVRVEGRRPVRTACSRSTTRRRSTRTPRTRPRPGSGRSSSTPTRARTSGSQGKARPVRLNAMEQAGTVDKAGLAGAPAGDAASRSSRPRPRPTRPSRSSPRAGPRPPRKDRSR